MSTTGQLIEMARKFYPSASTDAEIVMYMNLAQNALSAEGFGKRYETVDTLTVIDQEQYSFPSGLDSIGDIEYLAVSTTTAPADRYEYTPYKAWHINNAPASTSCYFQGYSSTGEKKICLSPIPDTDGLKIMIRFRKRLTDLSVSTPDTEPDIDSRFHIALAYYAAYMCASIGPSPDWIQANRFSEAYNQVVEAMTAVEISDTTEHSPERRDGNMWRRRRH